jgi:outer membrane protein assembly factor BamB
MQQNDRRNLRRTIYSLATVLLLTIPTLILPMASAQYTKMPDRDTYIAVGVSPQVIGIDQEVLINIFIYPGPTGATYEGQSLVSSLTNGYSNVSVTITRPDGTKETSMPIDSTLAHQNIMIPGQTQIVGNLMFFYKPSAVGNYSVTASFPGKTYTTDQQSPTVKMSVFYKPSSTPQPTIFTVQQESVSAGLLNGWPYMPLPQNYWADPVQTNNREWAAISGDWVQAEYDELSTYYNPYSTAPNSPHILWAQKIADSALPGGIWGSLAYGESASQYTARTGFTATDAFVILDGNVYRNKGNGNFQCTSLRTGQVLWEASGVINQAQRLDVPFQTASQEHEGGIASWLWGGMTTTDNGKGTDKWYRYSTFDGHLLQTITNVPTDFTSIRLQDGDPIVWCVQANNALWNTTQPLKIPYLNLIKWNFTKMINTVVYAQVYSNDWQSGIEWNISAVQDDFVSIGDNHFRGPNSIAFPDANVVIVRTVNAMQIMAGYDYTTGKFLWKNNHTVLSNDIMMQGFATSSKGPLIIRDGASPNYVAYDVKTGQEIWRASSGEYPWGQVPAYTYVYHNGTNFMGSYDGHVYAYDSATGNRVWTSDYVGVSNEVIPGNQPFNGRSVGADGKLYYSSSTEYQLEPRPRFLSLICINETTGHFNWNLPIGIQPRGIADGYLVGEDIDNGLLYCLGKGQTTTTVTAPDVAVTLGSPVVLKGTVMDQSPGKPSIPAVSDADMTTWMDYQYGQNATLINNPPKPNGVPVTLSVVDSNGNFREIGRTTSDSQGFFAFSWKPDIEGQYTIFANFAGTNSYYGSSAETSLIASAPASTASPYPAVNLPPTEMYFAISTVAIIIAIALVGVLLAIFLRKRP